MDQFDLDPQEEEIALMAVQALNTAHRRAVNSGRPVLVVVDGKLIRIGAQGRIVLKSIPPRRKVTNRVKRASS